MELKKVNYKDTDWKVALVNNILNTFDSVDTTLFMIKQCYKQDELYHYKSDDTHINYAITVSLLTHRFIKDIFSVKQLHDRVIQEKQSLYTFGE